ncbi:MAG: PAS domain-containing protein [Akkermansiaceae bacterium]|jgi:sigma-B regulation protein RsbU (phosphoserine phosphatase)
MSARVERLNLAFKASNEGVWDWEVATGEIYYSNRVLMFLGYGRIGAPNFFVDPESCLHPDDLENFKAKVDRVVSRNGKFIAVEPRIRSHDGIWKWFRVRGVPVRDPDGKLIRVVGSLIDISKRRMAEIALAEERSLINLLLDNVPVNVYFKDTESRFVRANVATAERMGAGTVEDLMGKTDHDFFESEHADAARAIEVELMQTGESQEDIMEHEVWGGGRESWVLVTKKVWYGMNGDVRGTFGVTHDVTELMETQSELERIADELLLVNQEISEERHLLRLVIDSIPMFVYFKDRESKFVLVNQGMAELIGERSPEDVVGKHDRDYFATGLVEGASKDEVEIMETGKPIIKKLEQIAWKDHHITWSMSSKFPWTDHAGKIIGTFGVSGDVTDLVETRNKLSEITDAMEAQNEALEEDLNLAREIQQAAVPRSLPTIQSDSWTAEFHHCCQPASDLAGDFLEVADLGENRVGFLVCDVMGHGVRAALIVSMLRGLIEKQRASAGEPGVFLAGLNEGLSHLLERTKTEMFATAFYGVVDLNAGEVRLASAGHPSPILKRNGAIEVLNLKGKLRGPALGMVPGVPYNETVLPLEGLEGLWGFTDGVFEMRNGVGEEFGVPRMCEVLGGSESGPLLLDKIVAAALKFSGAKIFEDDVCLLGIEFTGGA